MRAPKRILKNLGKVVVVLSILMISSCSDDDVIDAIDETIEEGNVTLPEALVTTYTGNLLYTPSDGTAPVMNIEGTATITSSNDEYLISFSDDVPTLNRISFIQTSESVYETNFGATSTSVILINDEGLSIEVAISGNSWVFDTN